MPRLTKKKLADQPQGPAGFVASAMQVASKRDKIRRAFTREAWQQECWEHFDNIGEYRYAQTWLAMAGSRAELVVEQKNNDGEWVEVSTGPACDYLNELLDGCGGKNQFLYTEFLHLGVPGESFIIGQDVTDLAGTVIGYRWRIVDAGELDLTVTPPTVTNPETDEAEPIGEDALILRVWRPHPREAGKADSPSHAVLPVLREIEHIGKHIAATVDSRLAGNGVWILPKEVSITTADGVTVDGNAQQTQDDPFMQTLVQAMVQPIADRDSPAAVVPLVIRMPGEFVQAAVNGHIKFGTDFDQQALPLRDAAIKRLALGLEMPPEQLLGLGDTNHWAAWQIEEAGVKTAIEPVLGLICDAITRQYLTPLLKVAGTPGQFRVYYRVDQLILRPNRAQDAITLHGMALVGDRTVREATGFDEGDAPTLDELKRTILIDLARTGKIDPYTGTALGLPPTAVDKEKIPVAPESQVPPALQPGAGGDIKPNATPQSSPEPATPAAGGPLLSSGALLSAAEPLVLRALERAGSKMRTRSDKTRFASIPAHETHLHVDAADPHRLLDGAWSLVASVAELHDVNPDQLAATLHTFTVGLLSRKERYGRESRRILDARLAVLPVAGEEQ